MVSVPCSMVLCLVSRGFAYSRTSNRPRSAIVTLRDVDEVPFTFSLASMPITSSWSSRLNLSSMRCQSSSLHRPERLWGFFLLCGVFEFSGLQLTCCLYLR
jgi:hypothetical protein